PVTFTAHPPHLRDGPLMASGFAKPCSLARAAPPPMRFVFLRSRLCLRLPSHPASRRRSCPRLVVGAINLHRGPAPPAHWSCRAYIENPRNATLSHIRANSRQHSHPTHSTVSSIRTSEAILQ